MNETTLELSLKTLNEFDDSEREIYEIEDAKNTAFHNIINLKAKRPYISYYLKYSPVRN